MRDTRISGFGIVALLALAVAAYAPVAGAQVTVSGEVAGDAVPGGTVTATAVVDIQDGSTVQSYSWSQVYGVEAMLTGADTDSVSVQLGSMAAYKDMLFHVIAEPPISADDLPPNVPVQDEFFGGLQNRFGLVGLNPFSLEEAALVTLELEVVTTSGTYTGDVEIHAATPWRVTTGIQNVPVGVPVLLHGKDQDAYDWAMTPANGSAATLADAATQNPEFVPDVVGLYTVTVTDMASGEQVSLGIYAGTWLGIITGQDADGRPTVDQTCMNCHNDGIAPDKFTPWRQTGHAEIFSSQLDESTHYSSSCFACHTVGFNTDATAANGGFDDDPNYQAFLDSGLLNNPGDNWTTVLNQWPSLARLANIQCENCHGPQNTASHALSRARSSLSADMCGSCHGEPARHGRYQQWQLSSHANYELATDESQSGTCSKCHTANGFLAWLPVLLGDVPGDPEDSVTVTWTADQAHPQTCQACHDPHAIGTVSGDASNATVRISGDTPMLLAGYQATDVGKGAICLTCHNTRRGLRNDSTWDGTDAERAPHLGAQGDVLMGQNAYFVPVGQRSYHSLLENSCVDCHMQATPPPDLLSYQQGGTNHTFFASREICADCHNVVTADDVQGPVEMKLEELQATIEGKILEKIGEFTSAGAVIDLGGDTAITSAAEVAAIHFEESHGRQGMSVEFVGGDTMGPYAMNSVAVIYPGADPVPLYAQMGDYIAKAGWNYFLIHSDSSRGVHNPSWVNQVLDTSITAVENESGGSGGGGGGNGGLGAVSCTSNFVYWTEIAARNPGRAGSVWRTDLVANNLGGAMANVELILHADSGDFSAMASVDPGAQGVFEDVVGVIGADNTNGPLEICSDQPLAVISRIYNLGEDGTFGQFIDGFGTGAGMRAGTSARLLGLRQMQDEFRTNISVTNGGTEDATVTITLFDASGAELTSYDLTVGSGMVVQDLEPFRARAGAANLGWGFATVEVTAGQGVLTSASVIDSRTNDATTIAPK